MNHDNTIPSYSDFERRISKSNTQVIDFTSDKYSAFVTDIYETWEDFRRLLPVFDDIVTKELNEDEFKNALLILGTWLWHTQDHVSRVKEMINLYDDE